MPHYPPAAVFITSLPDVTFEGPIVHIVSTSGRETFERVMRRSTWRRFLEREIRRLNEAEDAEQGRVVRLKPAAPKRRGKGEAARQRICPD